jgi:hypothetical protein
MIRKRSSEGDEMEKIYEVIENCESIYMVTFYG